MNIPQSSIEPFGYTGIPCVQFDDREMSKNIKLALDQYSDDFYGKFHGIQIVASGTKIIQNDLTRIAQNNGAINIDCSYMTYPSQVVFAVKYQLPHSKKRCRVGMGFRMSPYKPPL